MRRSHLNSKTALVIALAATLFLPGIAAAVVDDPVDDSVEDLSPPETLSLAVGEVRTLPVDTLQRVAIADPKVLDISILSARELLVQGKATGRTNLILWDNAGQHVRRVEVSDTKPEEQESQLGRIIQELGLSGVQVRREEDKLFLVGEISSKEDDERLNQMISAFKDVTNLVKFVAPPPAPEVIPPLVRLAVQVIEISRSDLEQLGVKWSTGFTVSESAHSSGSLANAVFQIGKPISRSTLSATVSALVEKKKARILSEPKLVTASGKEAQSFIGVEVPIISATQFGGGTSAVSASIDFRQTGVRLKMTPRVHEEETRRITTVLEAEVSKIDKSVGLTVPVGTQTILVPGFGVRKANTEVTTDSGETVIIAGLLEAEDSDTFSQVPGLGSMPVFGRLFRSPELSSTQREIIITVTPEVILDEMEEADRRMALERALSVAEVTASVEDPRLRYALGVQERIAKAIRYPQRERELNLEGTAKLKLHLFSDGTLGRANVSQSSGIESLDLEALKAAESQAPYPAFPPQVPEKELWLEVPVIFRP